MNCAEFQSAVGSQPGLSTPELQAHAASCSACARYREELQDMDRLIHRALSVPAPSETARPRVRSLSGYWAAAASFLAAVGLGSFLWLANPSESFAEQLVDHAQGEAFALVVTDERVGEDELAAVLGGAGVALKPDAMQVSYAMTCPFRGHDVPHLVVQTDQGPVTVLVLRHEPAIAKARTFREEGFEGVIVPAPEGVLAVLGKDAPVGAAAQQALAALEYSASAVGR